MTFLEQILRERLEKLAKDYSHDIDDVIKAILPAVEDYICWAMEEPKVTQESEYEQSKS